MKHITKKALSGLLALAMLLTLLPAVALTASADDNVASIISGGTETFYTNINDAKSNWADGSTLKLYSDFAFSSGTFQTAGKNLTFDLNSHSFSSGITLAVTGGSLTVLDSSSAKSGVVSGSQVAVYVQSGNFILESGTVGTSSSAMSVYMVGGNATLNGGTVLCGPNGQNYAVYSVASSVDITVDGATVGSETANRAIYANKANSVTVSSGTVMAKHFALVAYAGDVTIEGGTIQSFADSDSDESAVQISEIAHCTIRGGNIVSSCNGVYVGDFSNPSAGDKQLTMTGGTITAGNFGIASNGTAEENITINLGGGSVTGGTAAVYSPNRGETVNISGTVELTGSMGIAVKGGTVNISGGTITATGPKVDPDPRSSGVNSTGDAIYVEDIHGPEYNPTVNIIDGTVDSDKGYAVQYYTDETDDTQATGQVVITGGTFASPETTSEMNSSPLEEKIIISGGTYDERPNDDDLAPGKIAVETTGGKWTIADSYIKGYSLSLKGDIAVNYFIDLGVLDPAATIISFSWGSGADAGNASYDFSALTPDSGYYKISINVAAKQINDTITAVIVQGADTIETNKYSVARYARRVIADENSEFSTGANAIEHLTELQALCQSMLIYGAKAQLQFSYNTGSLADNGDPADVDPDALPAYPDSVDLSEYGLEFSEASLLLESTTTHRLYFNVTDSAKAAATKVKCGSKGYDLIISGSTAYVDIPNIAARNVLKYYTVRFSTDDFVSSNTPLRVNASSYIRNALLGSDDTLKATVKALHAYSAAADAYFLVK